MVSAGERAAAPEIGDGGDTTDSGAGIIGGTGGGAIGASGDTGIVDGGAGGGATGARGAGRIGEGVVFVELGKQPRRISAATNRGFVAAYFLCGLNREQHYREHSRSRYIVAFPEPACHGCASIHAPGPGLKTEFALRSRSELFDGSAASTNSRVPPPPTVG